MGIELIHADSEFTELCRITEFSGFDAVVSMSDEGSDSDWMLELPEQVWQKMSVQTGHYVYIPNSEWGGPVERVRHSSADSSVRIYGTCWRGLLARRAVCPPPGETHAVFDDADANDVLRDMLGDWRNGLFTVSGGNSGIRCSGRVRYDSMLSAVNSLFGTEGRLCISYNESSVRLWAEPQRDRRADIELSQEYESNIVSESRASEYDHIIALGQGEMLERTVAELWLLPDGTVTSDSTAALPLRHCAGTYIYDYPAAESAEQLKSNAERKLLSFAGGESMEITVNEPISDLELTDTVSVRDRVTGMTAALRVWEKNLNISADGAAVKHILK